MDIPFSDGVQTSVELKLRDDSPLAKATPVQLLAQQGNVLSQIGRPIDEVDVESVALGFSFKSPSALIGNAATITVKAGTNGSLTILKPSDKTVFPIDTYSDTIPIGADECWVGLELGSVVE